MTAMSGSSSSTKTRGTAGMVVPCWISVRISTPAQVYLDVGKKRGRVTFVESIRGRIGGAGGFALRMLILGGVSFALLIAAGLGAWDMANRAAEAERWIVHTMDVRRSARVLLVQLLDAETGERGFVLSEDPKFLEPFDRAQDRSPPASTRSGHSPPTTPRS